MLRTLLVVDDYTELLFLQTLLKKLGFDVDGIQNERSFEEAFLALNPDIVIATAKGKKVDGLQMAENLRKVRGLPKVIMLASGPMLDRLQTLNIPSVDGILESPVSAMRLLGMMAKHGGLDQAHLLEKYRKLKATLSPEREADLQILKRDEEDGELTLEGMMTPPLKMPSTANSGAEPAKLEASANTPDGGKVSTTAIQKRQQRFQKHVAAMAKDQPESDRFDRSRIQSFTKEIRANENPAESAKLEEERQQFVKELFKKARES